MAYPIRRFEHARIVNVVDGNTCDIEVDLGFSMTVKQRFKLAGIASPRQGEETAEFLRQFDGHEVEVDVTKLDCYGRYLAEIFVPSFSATSLNERMVEMGLATSYA